jgi:hypothetical protein
LLRDENKSCRRRQGHQRERGAAGKIFEMGGAVLEQAQCDGKQRGDGQPFPQEMHERPAQIAHQRW